MKTSLKEKAKSFLQLAGMGQVEKAYSEFASPKFIHHNPYFKGDRESLKDAMIEAHRSSPNISIEIKKIYQDGDTVITHSHVVKREMQIAVVHIFKFEVEKIVELWDIGQIMDTKSPNELGYF